MVTKTTSTKAPWKKPAPAKKSSKKLSPAQKSTARARAKKAGRPYPNLIDNMAVAKKVRSSKKKPARKGAGMSSKRKAT